MHKDKNLDFPSRINFFWWLLEKERFCECPQPATDELTKLSLHSDLSLLQDGAQDEEFDFSTNPITWQEIFAILQIP